MKSAIQLYRQHQLLVSNSKALEKQLLDKLCYQLAQAMAQDDIFILLEAIAAQRQFWCTLSALLTDEQHPYPPELRQQLAEIAAEVLQQLQLEPEQADLALVLQISQQLALALS